SGYDPFHLSQNDMEIAGKVIEIDVAMDTFMVDPPVATRFDELPEPIQESLTVIVKGVRNIPGIAYQLINNQYIKYVGNVGQDLVESVFSFVQYNPVPVVQLVQTYGSDSASDREGFPYDGAALMNLGWPGWEGSLPTSIIRDCPGNSSQNTKVCAYYDDAVILSTQRLLPLISYFHQAPRPDKFSGTALTGVQPYMGNAIPDLAGKVLFTDFVRRGQPPAPVRGVLAYTDIRTDCKLNDFSIIDVDYNFGSQSAYYVSLGTNMDQTRLFLGVYGSANVTNLNQGTIFEITP
ncbi:MAG: glucose dehydrogenase, partial [Syntrophomonadaceae bacterium]|nr:glucose dehydrogenase [Syntrophomonadaceae bacterium]